MALQPGTELRLKSQRSQFQGRVEEHGQNSMFSACKDAYSKAAVKDITTVTFTAQTSTGSVVTAGSGTLYGIRAVCGAAANENVLVQVRSTANSNRVIFAVMVPVANAAAATDIVDAEAYCFGGVDDIGIPFTGGIDVVAIALDDGANPDADDRPDVTVYVGL